MEGELQINGKLCLEVLVGESGHKLILNIPKGLSRFDYDIRPATSEELRRGIRSSDVAIRRDGNFSFGEWR